MHSKTVTYVSRMNRTEVRARFRVPADLLLPPPKKASASRPTKRAAA